MIANNASYTLYIQFTTTLAFVARLRDVNSIQIEREIALLACFLFSLLLMFIDENLEGMTQA